jgi:6,7-dimethyl-8-ribityllumazine synthase
VVRDLNGNLIGKGLHIAIVVSRFNATVTQRLLEGSIEGLKDCGVSDEDITVAWVPGTFEIPLTAKRLANYKVSKKRNGVSCTLRQFNAVICLGAVIRHETDHYRYISTAASIGIEQAARESNMPMIFGVLTTDTLEQAMERSGGIHGNKGFDAALTGVETANLMNLIDG